MIPRIEFQLLGNVPSMLSSYDKHPSGVGQNIADKVANKAAGLRQKWSRLRCTCPLRRHQTKLQRWI